MLPDPVVVWLFNSYEPMDYAREVMDVKNGFQANREEEQ